jgi:hypothetical protein
MSLITIMQPSSSAEGGSGSSAAACDPFVRLLLDRNIIQLSSTLIAKLEFIRYDDTRRGVFRTKWAADMFHFGVARLDPEKMKGFDIDGWYRSTIEKYAPEWKDKFDFKPSKLSQSIETNWMLHLLEVEKEVGGFMLLLHNCLELEDSAQTKMAEKSKKEDEYDFIGVGPRNKATQLFLTQGAAAAAQARIAHK